jgi:chromatin remodeling complex protein RSC6
MATAKSAPAKKAPATKVAPAKKVAAAPAALAEKVAAPAAKAAAKTAKPAAAPAAKRTPNPAFMKALTLSPELAAVLGDKPLPRTEIVKQLWVYIKAHGLQDATNKRNINADAKLKAVFGKPQVTMFEMAGLIGKHVK